MSINPFVFSEVHPDLDLGDFNPEKAYEMGVSAGWEHHFSSDQTKSLKHLINKEKKANESNGDSAYNTHWDHILEALGTNHDQQTK